MVKQAEGRQRPVNVATLEVYDPATDRWETRAAMPEAQGSLAAAAYDGKLDAFGGEQFVPSSKVFADAWVYDPRTDRFHFLPAIVAEWGESTACSSQRMANTQCSERGNKLICGKQKSVRAVQLLLPEPTVTRSEKSSYA